MYGIIGALAPIFIATMVVATPRPVDSASKKGSLGGLKKEVEHWSSPKFKKKLHNREIIVSVGVAAPKSQGSLKTLTLGGSFLVSKFASTGFERAKGFKFLGGIKSYITKFRWIESKRQLYIKGKAYKFHAQMWMEFQYNSYLVEGVRVYELHWIHTKGLFAGMKGVMRFQDIGRRTHQISMTAQYNFEKLPLPTFFLKFGLEVILRKVAYKFRSHLEGSVNDQVNN